MKTRGELQISFGWLFAIIAGISILFLAIFISTKIIKTEQGEADTTTAKKLDVLLNPLETSFESGKTTTIALSSETKIYNKCEDIGNFGKQLIQISQKSFGEYSDTGIDVSFPNKYIFSDEVVEGKKFYLTSKPFNYPFKVSDLIFLTSKEYCFVDAPEEIENEISDFQENIKVENCSDESVKICFMEEGCDVDVYWGRQYVQKGDEKLYFSENLLYAAIFSDKDIYECQVKRLMKRTEELASLYLDKSVFVANKGCYSNLEIELISLKESAKNFDISENFDSIDYLADSLNQKNKMSECKLW